MKIVNSVRAMAFAALALAMSGVTPVQAQVEPVDPDIAIDGDLAGERGPNPAPLPAIDPEPDQPSGTAVESAKPVDSWDASDIDAATAPTPAPSDTYHEDDLIGAAEGVFGKGALGLGEMIEDLLRKQGEPNGYITGREASGAIALGLRYGSGTLHHKVEGNRPVYWTGPSLGFDLGGNAGKAFVLVYNLYDTQDLYHRYGAGEGQAYLIGGFHVSYLRRGDVVLIPVRMGAGLRLGANVGYMKFTEKQNWFPF